MNLIALTTLRNTKGYDIFVLNPETNEGKGIQVKWTDKKDFPIANTYLKIVKEELHQKLPAILFLYSRECRLIVDTDSVSL
jgi:hypothetical protein